MGESPVCPWVNQSKSMEIMRIFCDTYIVYIYV
jgi:hypothetical protein